MPPCLTQGRPNPMWIHSILDGPPVKESETEKQLLDEETTGI